MKKFFNNLSLTTVYGKLSRYKIFTKDGVLTLTGDSKTNMYGWFVVKPVGDKYRLIRVLPLLGTTTIDGFDSIVSDD